MLYINIQDDFRAAIYLNVCHLPIIVAQASAADVFELSEATYDLSNVGFGEGGSCMETCRLPLNEYPW